MYGMRTERRAARRLSRIKANNGYENEKKSVFFFKKKFPSVLLKPQSKRAQRAHFTFKPLAFLIDEANNRNIYIHYQFHRIHNRFELSFADEKRTKKGNKNK